MDIIPPSPLLAAPAYLPEVAIYSNERVWTWRQIHAASLTLAQQLQTAQTRTVANLCTTRLGVLVVTLAAWRSQCTLIYPPSAMHGDFADTMAEFPQLVLAYEDASTLPADWLQRFAGIAVQVTASPTTTDDLTWQADENLTAAILFTSGSTGTPQMQRKTLGQLALGASYLGERLKTHLGAPAQQLRQIICSVPAQHMFGFEASVMLPLMHGLAVWDKRPMLPADIQAAFDTCSSPCLWVTTPMHLRALAVAHTRLQHCQAMLSSTMPLAPELVGQTEALTNAPLFEVYGSTETGAIATRRSAQEPTWLPFPSVQLTRDKTNGDTLVSSPHLNSPQRIQDRLELGNDGRFTLLGRAGDLIKVGGQRHSLTALNLLLQDLPGLEDGVFYLPESNHASQRLCLIYSGQVLARSTVEQWLKPKLAPAFIPRHMIHVARLPRNANGKLARADLNHIYTDWHMALGKADISFSFTITDDHPSLAGHFPGNPVVPGVLLLDHVMAGVEKHGARQVVGIAHSKFTAAMQPNEQGLVTVSAVDGRFAVSVMRGTHKATIATGQLRFTTTGGAP